MRLYKYFLVFLMLSIAYQSNAQCNQTLAVNSLESICNGDGTSTVTINITLTFGPGNNSVTISYNLGSLEVYMVIIEDNAAPVTNMDFTFDVPSCDNYTVSLIAWPNPSGGGNMCTSPAPIVSNITLPVTFGKVEALLSKNDILVKWNTLSEINNDYYIVEKSLPGNHFESIGMVNGAGTSNSLNKYSFVDNAPKPGPNGYRIMQVDYDGRYSYSEVVSFYFETSNRILVYPNPTSDYIQIDADPNSQFYLMNAMGHILRKIYLASENQRIDISTFPVGSYYLLDDQFDIVERLIKI